MLGMFFFWRSLRWVWMQQLRCMTDSCVAQYLCWSSSEKELRIIWPKKRSKISTKSLTWCRETSSNKKSLSIFDRENKKTNAQAVLVAALHFHLKPMTRKKQDKTEERSLEYTLMIKRRRVITGFFDVLCTFVKICCAFCLRKSKK